MLSVKRNLFAVAVALIGLAGLFSDPAPIAAACHYACDECTCNAHTGICECTNCKFWCPS